MAGRTTTATDHHRGRVHIIDSRRPRSCGLVAGIAGLPGSNVAGRFLQCVLRKVTTTVTGRTSLCLDRRLGVIHGCRRPIDIATLVASITLFGDLDMGRRHGQGILAGIGRVMTGGTLANSQHMTHLGRFEGFEILVAVRTLLGTRRNVPCRQAIRCRAVMAGRALAIGRRIMSVSDCRPTRCRTVTGVTLRRCGDVGCWLGLSTD